MRKRPIIPRIIKIQEVKGHKIHCMFNNGESRLLDFKKIFLDWNVSENDPEYALLDQTEFEKVELRNFTLSWSNITTTLLKEDGTEEVHPYELSPDVLYELSQPVEAHGSDRFGGLIKSARLKAGLTQEQLAERSGTSRFYISRLENDRTDVELSTLRKIVEAGLGKRFRVMIEE
ncbi:MAG: helix-turn-helix transcriptional regulator [Bacteroidota bacterium]